MISHTTGTVSSKFSTPSSYQTGSQWPEWKEVGDAKFSMCRDSIGYFDINVENLIPELDEVQRAEAFWKEEVVPADRVLTF